MREDWESGNKGCKAGKEGVETEMESWEERGRIGRGDLEAGNKGWESGKEG
jgi:hypothetical protein